MNATVSRTTRSARNASTSLLAQLLIILLGFATRSVFVAKLGVALLGINSLLTSTLAMLTLADLGINGAVMYALYKPLKDGDIERVASIVRYARRLFRWVALVVAVIGLAATPFIHRLVRLDDEVPHLEIYYLVLLCNTVAGYLMLNRVVLLNADQKVYIIKTYSMIFNTLRSVCQIVSLLLLESFLIYLLIQVAFTLANNCVVYMKAGRVYPFLRRPSASLNQLERKSIRASVGALVIFRVGRLVLQNSAPILISVIVGTIALGYYSNYMFVVSAAVMITDSIFTSLTPSVGNLIAGGDRLAGRRLFDEIVLLSTVLHGAIAVGIVVLVNEFVTVWLGSGFVLSEPEVIAIGLSFYVTGAMMPMWSFRNATGLFHKTQWMMAFTAILSIAFSFALGSVFGLAGVVISPAVAWLVTGGWYEPWLLIREHLSGGTLRYFLLQLMALLLWLFVGTVAFALGTLIPWGAVGSLLAKAGILAVMLPTAIWAAFGRTAAWQRLGERSRDLFRRRRPTSG